MTEIKVGSLLYKLGHKCEHCGHKTIETPTPVNSVVLPTNYPKIQEPVGTSFILGPKAEPGLFKTGVHVKAFAKSTLSGSDISWTCELEMLAPVQYVSKSIVYLETLDTGKAILINPSKDYGRKIDV